MAGSPISTDWVRRFHPAPEAATRLVCFPHAGGSSTFYFPVSQAMSPTVDVLAIQYPGRQDRRHQPCIDDIHALADAIVDELVEWIDRPVTLFGHSMGASVAYEVAVRLEQRGTTALGLFASGRRAPSRHRDEKVHLSDDAGLIREMKRLSGTESQILTDPDLLEMLLPAIRSDYRAAETYQHRPGPPLKCPVTALIGDADPKVTEEEARDWEKHTTGPFRLRVFPGGHFYINNHAQTVIRELGEHIGASGVR